ncbi:MAG: hypothetical protein QM779_13830 [Propionicimonas sp.]|uniref:hypothetical protein n=1 Tax=Propionicimonas sp. TaxID=1955623 RepID=UPI003D0F7832
MIVRVETASGSCHEVDFDTLAYRRLQLPVDPAEGVDRATLRRDGDELRLLQRPADPVIGKRWLLFLEPLDPAYDVTVRETTPVVAVEVIDVP